MSDDLSLDATCFQRNKVITWARPAASALFAATAAAALYIVDPNKCCQTMSQARAGLDRPSQNIISGS